ncbi:hypothetical protein OF83DRAFT_1088309 [Amylostereum chailletii]|nr:hypothetical protein OF83DRAFT_1088309 [Amylostereum chailletii]
MTSHLPNELLVQIIKDVASSQADLLRLRSTDRKFRDLASPHAFRVLHVGYTPKSAKGLESLLDSQAVAEYVEVISFEDTDEDMTKFVHDAEPNSDDEAMFSAYANALSALHRLPNLKSLSFAFFATDPEDEWETGPGPAYLQFQRTVFQALSRSPQPHPSLKSFKVEGILPYIHAAFTDPAFATFIGSLHHLRWSVLEDGNEGSYFHRPFQDYWATISTRVLRPAVSLRSLSLAAGDITGGMPYINLHSVHCPHLESLSLTNVQFAADTEAFIVQHKGTLTELELDRCAIDYGYARMRGIPGRSWADVWDRFSRELGKLRELKVRFEEDDFDDSDREDPQIRYIMFNDIGQGYAPLDCTLDGDDRDIISDRPALKALEDLLNIRKPSNMIGFLKGGLTSVKVKSAVHLSSDTLICGLEALKESSDACPPLKSAVGGLMYFLDLSKKMHANAYALKDIYRRMDEIQNNLPLSTRERFSVKKAEFILLNYVFFSSVQCICNDMKQTLKQGRISRFVRSRKHSDKLGEFVHRLGEADATFTASQMPLGLLCG